MDNKKQKIESYRPLGINGLVLGPAAIGLGIGIKNGFSSINANKANLSPSIGGRADRFAMIGKEVAKTTEGVIHSALNQAKANVVKGLQNLNSASFNDMIAKEGPQRNAVIAAYRAMLNSPTLGLNKDTIQAEENEVLAVLSSKNNQDVATDIKARIQKKMLEFGSDKQDEFIQEFQREMKSQLKLESTLKDSKGLSLPSFTTTPSITSRQVSEQEIMSMTGDLGDRLRKGLSDLQTILTNAGNKGSYTIHSVTDSRTEATSYQAILSTNKTTFDIPLVTGRRVKAGNGFIDLQTPGGFVFQSSRNKATGKSKFTSAIAVGGFRDSTGGDPISFESHALSKTKDLLERLKGIHHLQVQDAKLAFIQDTFDTGQRMSPVFNNAQMSNLIISTGLVNKTKGYKKEKISTRKDVESLVANKKYKFVGVGYSQMAEGAVFDASTPSLEESYWGYRRGDLSAASKTSSIRKTNTIINKNSFINEILGVKQSTQTGFATAVPTNKAIIDLNKNARTTSLVFYEMVDTYHGDLGLGDGAYMSGSTYAYTTSSSPLRKLKLDRDAATKEIRANAVLSQILEASSKGESVTIKRADLMKVGGMIGRSETGTTLKIPIDSTVRDVTFTLHNKADDILDLSYEVTRAPGSYNKIRGESLKGQTVKTSHKKLLERIASKMGISKQEAETLYKSRAPNTIIADADQLLRDIVPVRNQMITGLAEMLSTKGGLSKSEVRSVIGALHSSHIQNPMSNTAIAGEIAKIMSARNMSARDIASVVGSQYRVLWKPKRNGLIDPNELAMIHLGRDDLKTALEQVKVVVGYASYSIDTNVELQGAGKMASIERRSLHAIYQNLLSSGVSEADASKELANIMSRTGNARNGKNLITAQTLLASTSSFGKRDLSNELESMVNKYSGKYSLHRQKINQIKNVNLNTEDWFRNSTLIHLEFDTKASRLAASEVFGDVDKLFVPGMSGIPSIGRIKMKDAGGSKALGGEYQTRLTRLIKMVQDTNSTKDQLVEEMKGLQGFLFSASAESANQTFTGKVAGSTTARSWTINKIQNPKTFNAMQKRFEKDQFASFFSSDKPFFGMINSYKSFLKETGQLNTESEKELIRRTKSFLFGGRVAAYSGRHPQLGEGHGQLSFMRRVFDSKENSKFLKDKDVRNFLLENFRSSNSEFGSKAEENKWMSKTLNRFLRRKMTKEEGGNTSRRMNAFAELVYKKASRFKNHGDATFYYPSIDVEGIVNGNKFNGSISLMTQMFADVDGDVNSAIMHSGSVKGIKEVIQNKKFSTNMFHSTMEFAGIREFMKNRVNSMNPSSTMSMLEKETEETLKTIYAKQVGQFSSALDVLKVSVLDRSKDDLARQRAMRVLTIIEESGGLKAKHLPRAISIADNVAQAVFEKDGNKGRDMFFSAMKEHVFGDNPQMKIDYLHNGKNHTLDIDIQATLEHIWDHYKGAKESGSISLSSIKKISNKVKSMEGMDGNTYSATVNSLNRLTESLADGNGGIIQNSLSRLSGVFREKTKAEQTYSMVSKFLGNAREVLGSKNFLLPTAIGLGASLAINAVTQREETPALQTFGSDDAVQSNLSLLDNLKSSFLEPSAGQEQDYQFNSRDSGIKNDNYLSEGTGQISSIFNGINNLRPVKNIINSLGYSRNHVYIQDNRRPINKNTIDSFQEK